MEGHSICPLPEKKQSVSHIEKRCVEELKQQCFDHELQHGYLVLKHVKGTKRLAEGQHDASNSDGQGHIALS